MFELKKVVCDLGKQFVNIVVNIFGALKSVLIKIPADIIKYKLGGKTAKRPIKKTKTLYIKRHYTDIIA